MATLFYDMVEMITEWITGIENGSIKLWELQEYLAVSANVTAALNGIIFGSLVIVSIICVIPKLLDHLSEQIEECL